MEIPHLTYHVQLTPFEGRLIRQALAKDRDTTASVALRQDLGTLFDRITRLTDQSDLEQYIDGSDGEERRDRTMMALNLR